jgi:hypothetical protein
VEDGGVTHAAQVEIPASDPEIEADSIQRINDELEGLAAHMSSLFGLLSYLGHKVANDDLNLSSTFFALANNAVAAQDTLSKGCGHERRWIGQQDQAGGIAPHGPPNE